MELHYFSMLGKILVGVLNNRLTEIVKQIRKPMRIPEGILNKKAYIYVTYLIDHYVNKKNNKLFLCFVDFRKAFDKVDQSPLWKKLLTYGVNEKFMTLIRPIYSQVKSCVRSKYGITKFFKFTKGVRQGCLLSPLLFALFLNDLEDYLKENGASGIDLWDIKDLFAPLCR